MESGKRQSEKKNVFKSRLYHWWSKVWPWSYLGKFSFTLVGRRRTEGTTLIAFPHPRLKKYFNENIPSTVLSPNNNNVFDYK